LRYYPDKQPKRGDRYLYAPRTRFIPNELLSHFEQRTHGEQGSPIGIVEVGSAGARVDAGKKLRDLWA
jgi:DNA helicase-2/ATP-dependent DNA helicase PcrA